VSIKESSVAKLGSVCRRVYRIFSHAYFHHRTIFDEFEVMLYNTKFITPARTCAWEREILYLYMFIIFFTHTQGNYLSMCPSLSASLAGVTLLSSACRTHLLVVQSEGQWPIHITISLQYCPNKSLNSYCDASLCIMCLSNTIPNSYHHIKH
jgi:hypothetical protein